MSAWCLPTYLLGKERVGILDLVKVVLVVLKLSQR